MGTTNNKGIKIFDENGKLVEADSFVFYKTWLDSANKLKNEQDRNLLIYLAAQYGIYGKEPPEDIPEAVAAVFVQIKFHIDKQIHNYSDGGTGGRPPEDLTPIIDELPEELKQPMMDFAEHRKTINKKLNQRSCKILLEQLNELSNEDSNKAIQILNQSIANGWIGIFPLTSSKANNNKKSHNEFLEMLERGVFNNES